MRNRFMDLLATFAMMLAFSAVTFAQTYGTKGYSPGAWKPEELPKELSKPKPYNSQILGAFGPPLPGRVISKGTRLTTSGWI